MKQDEKNRSAIENHAADIEGQPVEEPEAQIKEPAAFQAGMVTGVDEPAEGIEEIEGATLELVNQLKEELEGTRRQADENLDGWQRSLADFSNYKKRVERDQALVYQQAAGNVIRRYLDISDDLERALKNRPQDGEGADWAAGIELIYRKLQNALQAEGVQPIEADGQQFDPTLHEAISQEENEAFESGQVIEAVQTGYMLGDRVLRPAVVRVAR